MDRSTTASPWRGRVRRSLCAGAALSAVTGAALASAGSGLASSSKATVCSGTAKKPGVLAGKISSNVVVKGVCEVSQGSATVKGSLTVSSGGALLAIFGRNDKTGKGVSNLTVNGNITVGAGATAAIGCEAAHFPCVDDNQKHPRLNNQVKIGGNLVSNGSLGTIVHVTKIGGSVSQKGGGGGQTCSKMPGIFAVFKSPQYSDYEDNSIGGSLMISNLSSCWLGALRNKIGKSFTLKGNKMADPDAIEIGTNTIAGNLACTGNKNAVPSSAVVWDTVDTSPSGALYPRAYVPNKVKGKRSGQCVRSTPTKKGGPYGKPGTF
jgi:hypothetical protein